MVGPLTALLALWAQAAEADQEAATPPAQGELSCSRWQDETRVLAKSEWITHVVRPRERLAQIAVRYGVTAQDLAAWNKLSSPRARVRAGKKLKVKTTRVPPPREKIVYAAAEGEDWSEVAIRHRVAVEDLKAWNSQRRGRPRQGFRGPFRRDGLQIIPGTWLTLSRARRGSRRVPPAPRPGRRTPGRSRGS